MISENFIFERAHGIFLIKKNIYSFQISGNVNASYDLISASTSTQLERSKVWLFGEPTNVYLNLPNAIYFRHVFAFQFHQLYFTQKVI